MEARLAFSIIILGTCAAALILSAFAFSRRKTNGALALALVILACTIYSGGYIAELWAGTLPAILACVRVEYLGIAFVPPFYLAFVLRFTGRRVPRPLLAFLLAMSSITFLLVLSSSHHELYYRNIRLDSSGPFPTMAFDRGPWYVVNTFYLWGSLLAGEAMLIAFLFKVPPLFKAQAGIAAVAALLPVVANVVYQLGVLPHHLDPTPSAFPLFTGALSYSLFRFRFLDIAPIAWQRVVDALEDGVIVVDREGRMVEANPAASAMLKIGPGSAGLSLDEAIPGKLGLSALLGPSPGSLDFPLAQPDGSELRCRARAFPLLGHRGHRLGTAILVADVTETVRLVSRLDELASTDPLTGLYNRRRFFELALRELALARRGGQTLVVCIADLDHFKDVNDQYGHATGDALLRSTADCFRSCLRSTDIVCRYGGEEFAVLFPGSGIEEALLAVERLRATIASSALSLAEGGTVSVTASFGLVGLAPGPADSLDAFLERADAALYRAKDEGRNRVCVS